MMKVYSTLKFKFGKHLAVKILIFTHTQWAFEKIIDYPKKLYLLKNINNIIIYSTHLLSAANRGCTEVLIFLNETLRETGRTINDLISMPGLFRLAAEKGHLNAVKWLYSIMDNRKIEIFSANSYAFIWAVYNCHVELSDWFYKKYMKLGREKELKETLTILFKNISTKNKFSSLEWLYNKIKTLGCNIEYELMQKITESIRAHDMEAFEWFLNAYTELYNKPDIFIMTFNEAIFYNNPYAAKFIYTNCGLILGPKIRKKMKKRIKDLN